MVGYPEGTKGYKIYNLQKGTFAKSRDVEFSERQFHDFETPVTEKTFDNLIISVFSDEEANSGNINPVGVHNEHQGGDLPQVEGPIPIVEAPIPLAPVIPVVPVEPEVMPSYEETFMRQVQNLGDVRTRKQRQRLGAEDANLLESCNLTSLIHELEEPTSYSDALLSESVEKWK